MTEVCKALPGKICLRDKEELTRPRWERKFILQRKINIMEKQKTLTTGPREREEMAGVVAPEGVKANCVESCKLCSDFGLYPKTKRDLRTMRSH